MDLRKMIMFKGKTLIYLILSVWIILSVNFILRDLYKKGDLRDYEELIFASAEEKHAITYGRNFFEFLEFAKKNIPEDACYNFSGVKEFSLDQRRGAYYMYPAVSADYPDYILVYGNAADTNGFSLFKSLDKTRFILKKDKI